MRAHTLIKIENMDDGNIVFYNPNLPMVDDSIPGGGVRGNYVTYDEIDDIWYNKEGEIIEDPIHTLPCPKCEGMPTPEGHDNCLGELPGVKFACCGHGKEHGYIMFENGRVIRGNFYVDR